MGRRGPAWAWELQDWLTANRYELAAAIGPFALSAVGAWIVYEASVAFCASWRTPLHTGGLVVGLVAGALTLAGTVLSMQLEASRHR